MSPRIFRAHGLGNDYLVWPGEMLTERQVRALCDRNCGVGSDGVLVPVTAPVGFDCAVRIFNPDGSEAEKSGNGVRIFALWWFLRRAPGATVLRVWTLGGPVNCELVRQEGAYERRYLVRAELGLPQVMAADVPGALARVNIGNPHLVMEGIPEGWERLGARLEHSISGRTNVQFAEVVGDGLKIRIWERGAGATLSSGSSACAASAAFLAAGRIKAPVRVQMQGGEVTIGVIEHGEHAGWLLLEGPIEPVGELMLEDGWMESKR